VANARLVGLQIHLDFFVLADLSLLDIADIDARAVNRLFFISARDDDGQARILGARIRLPFGIRIFILASDRQGKEQHQERGKPQGGTHGFQSGTHDRHPLMKQITRMTWDIFLLFQGMRKRLALTRLRG
jgi:hypothetical protein